MTGNDFNLLDEIEQIQIREQQNLQAILAIQENAPNPIFEIKDLQDKSEALIVALNDIAEKHSSPSPEEQD